MSEVSPQIDQLLSSVQKRRESITDQARREEDKKANVLGKIPFLGNRLKPTVSEPDIMTDRRFTRESETVPRSPTTRLIRGSLAATLKDIKNDPQLRIDVLPGFVRESRKLAENLDKLDTQFHTTGKFLEAGKSDKKKDSIYAVTLDLREPSDEPDNRIPWVMIGGAYSTSEQNAALSMALALQGEKVVVLTHPEQMRDQEGMRGPHDLLKNTAQEDMQMFKNAVGNSGLQKVNLLGDSLGGAFALAIASDPEFAKKIQIENVVLTQPVGFEPRAQKDLMAEGSAEERRNVNDPEAKVIMAYQGNTDAKRPSGAKLHDVSLVKRMLESRKFISPGKASGTQINDTESIKNTLTNISGDLEIWTNDGDNLSRSDVINDKLREAMNSISEEDRNRLSSYVISGARHNELIVHGFGFIRARREEQDARHIIGEPQFGKTISLSAIERSGAEYLLKQMRPQAPSSR